MNILLIDDHAMLREALKFYLPELDSTIAVTTAGSLDEALQRPPDGVEYDLIVLDFELPGVRGFAGYEAVAAWYPGIPVVMLSGAIQRSDALGLIDAGAAGVIPKRLGAGALIHALKLILSGEKFLPVTLDDSPASAGESVGESAGTMTRNAAGEGTAGEGLGALTLRQREVLALLKQGLPNKQIAARMGIQEVTVKLHLSKVFGKLGATNRTEAVRIALESDSADSGRLGMTIYTGSGQAGPDRG
jgi:DNA-binding NarL/FixJ family response regulator